MQRTVWDRDYAGPSTETTWDRDYAGPGTETFWDLLPDIFEYRSIVRWLDTGRTLRWLDPGRIIRWL